MALGMLERSKRPPWMRLASVLVEMNRSWECGNEPANSRQTGKPANLVVRRLHLLYLSPSPLSSLVRCSFAM